MSQQQAKDQQQGQAAQGAALAKSGDSLVGSFYDPLEVDRRLKSIAQGTRFHLVTPAPICGSLTVGYEASISVVHVDVDHETYETGGDDNVGLSKAALDKIAGAAGIEPIPELCGRLDDGSDPHYCHYRWVGRMKNFDGSWKPLMDEKEMDLREGSPQVKSLARKSSRKVERELKKANRPIPAQAELDRLGREKADNQITEMRLHILGHAITKARLRAIRSIGVRTNYKRDELAKPFAVVGIRFTGRCADPETQRMFAARIAENALPSTAAMFGERAPARTPPSPAFAPATHHVVIPAPPPPVGTRRQPDPDDEIDEAEFEEQPRKPSAPQQQAEQPAAQNGGPKKDAPVFKFGNDKGLPLCDAGDEDLDWYVKALRKSVKDPNKAQYKAQNQKDLDDAIAEQKTRKAAEREDEADDDDGGDEEQAGGAAAAAQQEGLKLGGRRRS